MKRLALAASVLVLTLAAAPAQADYALVRFGDGFCRIWWNSAGNPWGVGWTKLVIGLPNYLAAQAVFDGALARGICR